MLVVAAVPLPVLPALPVLPVLLVLPALLAHLALPAHLASPVLALPTAFVLTLTAVPATGMATFAGDTQLTHSGVEAMTTTISHRFQCVAPAAVAVPIQQ